MKHVTVLYIPTYILVTYIRYYMVDVKIYGTGLYIHTYILVAHMYMIDIESYDTEL